jgi:hypothetical protein
VPGGEEAKEGGMKLKTYVVMGRYGLNAQSIEAYRPTEAVMVWLSRVSRWPVRERDISEKQFKVYEDGFHIEVL